MTVLFRVDIVIVYSANKEPPCFPSDFREVNKRLIIKPFSIPKICTVLQSLKTSLLQQPLISTWAMTPLDWIRMHPKSAPSISLETNTRHYQWEGQVLQTFSKMELMESLEYARAYTDDLLCI